MIADGMHLHPAVVRLIVAAKGPERVTLVTDAVEAGGMPDGRYLLGNAPIEVKAGRAQLVGSDSLAGSSTLTMDRAVAFAAAHGAVPLAAAVAMASAVPARVLGLERRKGLVEPGYDADPVVLAEDLAALGVMRAGRWLHRDGALG